MREKNKISKPMTSSLTNPQTPMELLVEGLNREKEEGGERRNEKERD